MTASAFDPSVESVLGFADDTVDVLRPRILTALRYTFSWGRMLSSRDFGLDVLTGGASLPETAALAGRVSDMQAALKGLLDLMPLSDIFPRTDAANAYERVSAAWSQLYRDLALSASTLPQPELLNTLGDIGTAFFQAPGAAATAIAEETANGIARLLGGTAGAIWSALWPWLLLGAAVGGAYLFRRPLGRLVGKVTA